jgi:pimeloyl-ACP methyl ester carboxylesterase
MTDVAIRRGFVDIAEGQIHYRTCGPSNGPILVMLHGSPLSSYSITSMMKEMGRVFRVIAPDMLGNGDSSPPTQLPVTFPYLADAMVRGMEALGLTEFFLYGFHTGGNLAIEAALARPEAVKRLIIEGVGLYSPEERTAMLANQAPEMKCDHEGTQLLRAWHLVRDGKYYWPWWNRTKEGARSNGLPSPDNLNDQVVELLKAVRTYHHSYRASFSYDKVSRMKLLRLPVLVSASESDPLRSYLEDAVSLIPGGRLAVAGDPSTEEGQRKTAQAYTEFLLNQ